MRSFLAIPLPEPLREAGAAVTHALRGAGSGWRPVSPDGLHITIRFLGDVEASRAAVLDAAWLEAARGTGSLTLQLRGVGVYPSERRPRLIWLGVDDLGGTDALARLARRIELAARAQGLSPEERMFSPHVTLARARPHVRRAPVLPRVEVLGHFVAESLVRYRSDLGPGGARYREEASFPFCEGRAS